MSGAGQRLLVDRQGAVARITFNKPERMNAMSLDMWQGLHRALDEMAADDAVRVVVLTGAGDRAFVSGADISEFEEQRASEEKARAYNAISEAADAALYNFPKPTIARIHGYCVGGGMGLAIGCDFRICTPPSRFGITAGRLGLGYAMDGLQKLVALAGPSVAARIMYTADLFPAEDALAMGLVTEVVPRDALDETVNRLAGTIASRAPLTVRAAKAAIRASSAGAGAPDRETVERMVAACFASEDYAEGRAAFAQKRPAAFRGR